MTNKIIIAALGVLGLTACAMTPEVTTKISDGVHLEQYKTYALRSGKVFEPASVRAGDETEVGQALEADIREELKRRGLNSEAGNPDLIFSYAVAKRPVYLGERQWKHEEGAVDLTATDKDGRIIWNSHLQSIIDPADKTHLLLKKAVQKAFKNYPSINP